MRAQNLFEGWLKYSGFCFAELVALLRGLVDCVDCKRDDDIGDGIACDECDTAGFNGDDDEDLGEDDDEDEDEEGPVLLSAEVGGAEEEDELVESDEGGPREMWTWRAQGDRETARYRDALLSSIVDVRERYELNFS